MRERTQSFSDLISERILELAKHDPDKWTRPSEIAYQVSRFYGRSFHPWKVSRLLRGERGLIEEPEVAAWIAATGLDRDPDTEAEAWAAAGVLPNNTPLDAVRQLLDARRMAVAVPTETPFADRRAARRRGGGAAAPVATEAPQPPAGGGVVRSHLRACTGPGALRHTTLTGRSRTAHDARSVQVEHYGVAA